MARTNKLPEGSTWEQFKLENVQKDTNVSVTFAPDTNKNSIPDKYEEVVVTADTDGNGTVSPSKKNLPFGESVTLSIKPNKGFVVDTITIGDTVYVNDPNFGVQKVSSPQELEAAVQNAEISTVKVEGPMSISGVQFDRPITIDGNNQEIKQTATGKAFTLTQSSVLKNMVVKSEADNTEWHSSYNLQFYKGKHEVDGAVLSGGNAGIIVNGAEVTLKGTIDVSNNTFGGIEVSKGKAEGMTAGVLDITNATLVNSSEAPEKPTIWIDGLTEEEGRIIGLDTAGLTEVTVKGQKQYYLRAENAPKAE